MVAGAVHLLHSGGGAGVGVSFLRPSSLPPPGEASRSGISGDTLDQVILSRRNSLPLTGSPSQAQAFISTTWGRDKGNVQNVTELITRGLG